MEISKIMAPAAALEVSLGNLLLVFLGEASSHMVAHPAVVEVAWSARLLQGSWDRAVNHMGRAKANSSNNSTALEVAVSGVCSGACSVEDTMASRTRTMDIPLQARVEHILAQHQVRSISLLLSTANRVSSTAHPATVPLHRELNSMARKATALRRLDNTANNPTDKAHTAPHHQQASMVNPRHPTHPNPMAHHPTAKGHHLNSMVNRPTIPNTASSTPLTSRDRTTPPRPHSNMANSPPQAVMANSMELLNRATVSRADSNTASRQPVLNTVKHRRLVPMGSRAPGTDSRVLGMVMISSMVVRAGMVIQDRADTGSSSMGSTVGHHSRAGNSASDFLGWRLVWGGDHPHGL